MKKLFILVLAVLSFVSAACAEEMKFISEFEGGKLYKAGKLNVVVMKGNFYQMGRQYGTLLNNEIKEFYEMAVKDTGIGTEIAPYDEVLAEMKNSLKVLPFYVREWIRGMGETSGLGADKQIIFCQILIPLIMGKEGCSGLMAWGEYTKDGSTVIGRNWDLPGSALVPYQKFMNIAVFNPVGSAQGVADINYIGQIVWQSAMNQSGLFYDLQNGGMSDPSSGKNRLNSNSALMSMMLDSTSMQQVDAFFDAVRAEGGLIINVADAKQGYCYEWGTADYRRRVDNEKGLLVATNHFIDPTWHVAINVPEGKNGGFSKERCTNLLALAEKHKGNIDANKMMEFFSATILNGGPSFHSDSGFKTYYSIVAVPEELKLWLRVSDLQDWNEVDLKPLFE
jgi:hypothetical protein